MKLERILNDEEKIRRAEEIYYRRNNQNYLPESKEKKVKKSAKEKFLLNLLIMIDIVVIVFAFQNKEYIFTKDFLNQINNYNNEMSNEVINIFKEFVGTKEVTNNKEEIIEKEETNSNVIQDTKSSENIIQNNQENVIKTPDSSSITVEEITSSSMNEMELDIKNLKNAYKFINPLPTGVVSSMFGSRESKYQNVRGYHTGIDLAEETGKTIVASMEGIVEEVSSKGDYGKHIKIRCNNITTLYAHCSKIYVEEGQIVAENQAIAAVGSTGNSTGPHLHFEIRVEDRFVDPAKIIKF